MRDSAQLVSCLAEGGVFGVPLSVLLQNDQQKVPTASIPLVVQEVRVFHCIQVW